MKKLNFSHKEVSDGGTMEKTDKIKRAQANKEIIEWAKSITIAIFIAVIIRSFVFEIVLVDQSSMYPTLKQDDKIAVIKVAYLFNPPERGDIVIVKIDETLSYVKRVIAFGGETIEIKDSKVYINGTVLKEDYLVKGIEYDDYAPVRVPEGTYFVMGDNRPISLDSRVEGIGFIKQKAVLGKVIFKLKPFTTFK